VPTPVSWHVVILGFRTGDARVLAHSVLGTFLYGVFVVKLFFVHDRGHPRWSSLWYFTQVRLGF
jgi:hypothetical protein